MTGVQTCALPICVAFLILVFPACCVRAGETEVWNRRCFRKGNGLEKLLFSRPPPALTVQQPGTATNRSMKPANEIGRASCRERVEISGVAVSLKKKSQHLLISTPMLMFLPQTTPLYHPSISCPLHACPTSPFLFSSPPLSPPPPPLLSLFC